MRLVFQTHVLLFVILLKLLRILYSDNSKLGSYYSWPWSSSAPFSYRQNNPDIFDTVFSLFCCGLLFLNRKYTALLMPTDCWNPTGDGKLSFSENRAMLSPFIRNRIEWHLNADFWVQKLRNDERATVRAKRSHRVAKSWSLSFLSVTFPLSCQVLYFSFVLRESLLYLWCCMKLDLFVITFESASMYH